jgi:hypothetical protein
MNDETKIAMFDSLFSYLINSSSAMSKSVMVMALDPLHISHVNRLYKEINAAKWLMTWVILPCIKTSNTRFPLLCTLQENRKVNLSLDLQKKV